MVDLVHVLNFFFSTNLFPRYRIRYFYHDTDTGSVESTYFKFRFGIFRLIEYTDSASQQYVRGQSNVIKVWNLLHNPSRGAETLTWSKISKTPISSTNGTNGWDLSTSVSFTDGTQLTLTTAFSADQMRDTLHNRSLNPNAIKFSIDITNIAWAVNNSRLAIVSAIDAVSMNRIMINTSANPVDPNNSESELDIGDHTEGRMTWVKNIAASFGQGVTSNYPILSSNLLTDDTTWTSNGTVLNGDDSDAFGDEARQIIIYSIISPIAPNMQPTSIMWDPVQQVDDATLDTTTSTGASTSINPLNYITYITILIVIAILQ